MSIKLHETFKTHPLVDLHYRSGGAQPEAPKISLYLNSLDLAAEQDAIHSAHRKAAELYQQRAAEIANRIGQTAPQETGRLIVEMNNENLENQITAIRTKIDHIKRELRQAVPYLIAEVYAGGVAFMECIKAIDGTANPDEHGRENHYTARFSGINAVTQGVVSVAAVIACIGTVRECLSKIRTLYSLNQEFQELVQQRDREGDLERMGTDSDIWV